MPLGATHRIGLIKMNLTATVILIIILAAIAGWGIVKAVKCLRDIAYIRYVEKTENPIYHKQGLVMNWTDNESASADADYTIVTPD